MRDLIGIVLSAFAIMCFGLALPAKSHDQHLYDMACCDVSDCKPVADGVVEEKADGVHNPGAWHRQSPRSPLENEPRRPRSSLHPRRQDDLHLSQA